MKKFKRPALYALVMLFLFSLSLFGCAETPTGDVIARVNGRDVTRKELNNFIGMIYLYMPDLQEIYKQKEHAALLEEEILWLLIEYIVLEQEVERLSLKLDQAELELNFRQLREDLIMLIYETEENFLTRLQELQLAEEQLKTIPRSTMLRELLYQHISAGVTEEDALAFVQENPFFLEQEASVYAYRILVESLQEAQEVRRLLERGADFVETGEKYSREGYVELGHIKETDKLDPHFMAAAFQLKPGEISEPVETVQGYYIIMITEKEEASTLTFEQVKAEAMASVKEERYEEYFHQLLRESNIETFKEKK
ncbi:MAG: peptidyl-prolyl cis-trans isomerase [Bacillota bacterium]